MDRYYSLASDVLVDICCIRYVILYMDMLNVCSSSGNHSASANVSTQKLIVLYRSYTGCTHKSHCIVYCILLKSIDLTNHGKAYVRGLEL